MNTALYGRTVFGASAVLFGVVALLWHHSDMWRQLHSMWMPLSTIIAWCLTIGQLAGGIGMLLPRTTRFASIVLGVIYVLFSLACIPGIIALPKVYVQYGDFFERFSVVCGAIAVYAATETNAARSEALGRVARLGLGLCAISFTLAQIVYLQYTASLVPTWIPPNQMFWAVLTTLAFALAAVAILINRQALLAIRLMALMMALFGVLVWIPHIIARPEVLSNWSEFAATFLMAGAAWMVADFRSFGLADRPG